MRWILSGLALWMFVGHAEAAILDGNGNTGFGGPIGESTLELTDDGSILDFLLTRGAGELDDTFVLYIDTTEGGFSSNASIFDELDASRRAVSGCSGASCADLTFGLAADFALAFDAVNGGILYELADGANGSLVFVAALGGSGNPSDSSFAFSVSMSSLGLSSEPHQQLRLIATYINASNAYRSNEGYGQGLPAGNPGNPSSVTMSGYETYTTVPEASNSRVAAIVVLAGLGTIRRWRRGVVPRR